jgi:hypothetical protein
LPAITWKRCAAIHAANLGAQRAAHLACLPPPASASGPPAEFFPLRPIFETPRAVQIAGTMQQFEKQFENLDLQTQVVDGVMSSQAALSTPEEEVSALMLQVADEHGLELQIGLPGAATAVAAEPAAAPEADLSTRLAELKGR